MIANFITGSRIIFSLAILNFPVFSAGFYFCYMLTANLDALFDKGYISFTDDGLLMLASVFSFDGADMRGLGIHSDMKLRWVEDRHLEFLDYHHKKVWKN